MSVLMLLRVKGDARKVEQFAAEDPAAMKSIIDRAKSNGLIRHRFFGTADEVIVVDEWPVEASFQRFFDASPEIADMMAKAGVTTPPDITFARQLDVDDAVG
jgi:heme-degrading monooxygenase HmoA